MRSHRSYERQIDKLFAIIEAQNDRIMYLADRPWATPPIQEASVPEQPPWMDESRFSFVPERDADLD